MKKICLCLILSLVAFYVSRPTVLQALEANVYVITDWIAECPGGDRPWWDNMCDEWYDEITDCRWLFGHPGDCFSRDRRRVNGNMRSGWFAEDFYHTWGRDDDFIDEADAALIGMHGGDEGGYWRGACRRIQSGDGTLSGRGPCHINAVNELRAGDFDLEFLHLSSCHSLDDNIMINAWHVFGRPDAAPVLHQLDGFHGCMWIGWGYKFDYEDFADDAFDMSIALAWVENMYRRNIGTTNYEQCPVAYAIGRNARDCFNRRDRERYDNVFSDPVSPYDNAFTTCWMAYENCGPDCEDPWYSDLTD
jgi:hypothetical protein